MNFLKTLYYDFRRKAHLRILKKAKSFLRFSHSDSFFKTSYVCIAIKRAQRSVLDFSYSPEAWSYLIEKIHLKGSNSVYLVLDKIADKVKKKGVDYRSNRIWVFENEDSDELKSQFCFEEFLSQVVRHHFLDFLIAEVEKGNYDKLYSLKAEPYDFTQFLLPEVRALLSK